MKSGNAIYGIIYLSLYSFFLIFQLKHSETTMYDESHHTINNISLGMFIIILYNHIINKDSIYQITLCLIYILYTINDMVNSFNMESYIQARSIMWLIASPLMIQQYLEIHQLTWWDIKLQLHVLAQFLYCFPSVRNQIFIPACILESIFFYYFLKYRHLPHTKFGLQIWFIFSLVIIGEHLGFISIEYSPLIFKILDIMGKGTWLLNMSEPKLTEIMPKDIHSLRLMGGIEQFISNFTKENELHGESLVHINHLKKLILKDIQIDTTSISAHLLEMILPYGLDRQYLLNTNKPIKYNEIVVLMTDIVGYTGLALTNDEKKIYNMLHNLYLHFDSRLNKKTGIQKIETIGDAYMAVGDLSEQNDAVSICSSMLQLAHELINDVNYISSSSSIPIKIRIGISMGPVVIGTLGTMIPRMCVVGHTVNLASRLQSSADPQSIQISITVYNLLSKADQLRYQFEKRTDVELKHIGKVDTMICYPDSIQHNNLQQ